MRISHKTCGFIHGNWPSFRWFNQCIGAANQAPEKQSVTFTHPTGQLPLRTNNKWSVRSCPSITTFSISLHTCGLLRLLQTLAVVLPHLPMGRILFAPSATRHHGPVKLDHLPDTSPTITRLKHYGGQPPNPVHKSRYKSVKAFNHLQILETSDLVLSMWDAHTETFTLTNRYA